MKFDRSQALSARAHELIPGGCHTYSKGDDQFPELAPGFIERANGCRAWDVDGNELIDWGMALRSVILGHCHPAVLDAVVRTLERGSNFTRPAPIELELAEAVTSLIPCAEMVKFAKNGSDVTSAALRLARAFTGRSKIAFCRENPFYSFHDWFIGTTPMNAGVPPSASAPSLAFQYNDIASLEALFDEHPEQIAAVILEPASVEAPGDRFLERVRDLAHAKGALVVFDEMITGFRFHLSGAQAYFGVTPDLACFGKAFGNGFSVAMLAGRKDVMELGGIKHAKPKVFLLSATNGAETHALAAGLATIRELASSGGVERLWRAGRLLKEGVNAAAKDAGLASHVSCVGYDCSPVIQCRDATRATSLPFRTLFLQETITRGVLIPYVAPSIAHRDVDVAATLDAVRAALVIYARALTDGVERHLVGPAVKPVFRRFNSWQP